VPVSSTEPLTSEPLAHEDVLTLRADPN